MAKKNRNFKEEYFKRKQRGLAKGLSVSQARGHPKPLEQSASERTASRMYSKRLEAGIREIRRGTPLTKAAKIVGVSPELLRKYVHHAGIATKAGRRWRLNPDRRKRRVQIFSDGRAHTIFLASFSDASLVGRYTSAIGQFVDTSDPSYLAPFIGMSVTDEHGRRYPFETRRNVIYRLTESQAYTFEEIYRIVP